MAINTPHVEYKEPEPKRQRQPPPEQIPEVPIPSWALYSGLANTPVNRRWFAVQENMDWCNSSGDFPQDSMEVRRSVLTYFAANVSPAAVSAVVFIHTKKHIAVEVAKAAKMAAVRAELSTKYKDMEVSMADFETTGIIKTVVYNTPQLCTCCGSLNTVLNGFITRVTPENMLYRHRLWFLPDLSKVSNQFTDEQKAPIGLPCNLKLEDPESGTLLIEWSDE